MNLKYARGGRILFDQDIEEIMFLDPKAGKAVGKVEVWGTVVKKDSVVAMYVDNMHEMIDALIAGKTLEEYINTL